MNRTLNLLAAGALALALCTSARAQSPTTKPTETTSAQPKPAEAPLSPSAARAAELYDANRVTKTYYLTSVTQQNDANEILIALRNMLSASAKIYLVEFQSAIVLSAPPEQQALAQKIIADLDRTRKAYRLTFTLAESDGGKRIGIQHFALVVASGQRTVIKQGSKIPVITGTYNPGSQQAQNQFQYLDIGINFDATLDDAPNGLRLKTKVEQSSVGNPSEFGNTSGPLAGEPIFHQTSLEGSSIIVLGKPLTLGSLDVPGSTSHIDIEVVAEPIS
jgi:type II secretory pathway component GspD/PulD (secretin)